MTAPRFNEAEGLARQAEGIARAEANRKEIAALARKIAVHTALISPDKVTDMDCVQEILWNTYRIPSKALGNAAGGTFRCKPWVRAGRKRTCRVSSNARFIERWKYDADAEPTPLPPSDHYIHLIPEE